MQKRQISDRTQGFLFLFRCCPLCQMALFSFYQQMGVLVVVFVVAAAAAALLFVCFAQQTSVAACYNSNKNRLNLRQQQKDIE